MGKLRDIPDNVVLLPDIIGAEEMGVILSGCNNLQIRADQWAGPFVKLSTVNFQTFCFNVDFPK